MVEVSIVTAMHNSADYLDAYFSSIGAQTLDRSAFEVVLVDDGSTDDSALKAQQLLEASGLQGRVYRQERGRQGAARNRGLSEATGRWGCFIDSDDVVSPDYLERCLDFFQQAQGAGVDVRVAATRLVPVMGTTGHVLAKHPQDWRFQRDSDVVVNLNSYPDYFQMGAGDLFFDLAFIRDEGIRFDERVYPIFEDAAFIATALSASEQPLLGLISSCEYIYNRWPASSISTAWSDPARYDNAIRYGQLGLLEHFGFEAGQVPSWLASMILYDLCWSLNTNAQMASPTDWLPEPQQVNYVNLINEVTSRFTELQVFSPFFRHASSEMRSCFRTTAGDRYASPVAVITSTASSDLLPEDSVELTIRSTSTLPFLEEDAGASRFVAGRKVFYYSSLGFHEYVLRCPKSLFNEDFSSVTIQGFDHPVPVLKAFAPAVPRTSTRANFVLELPHTRAQRARREWGRLRRAPRSIFNIAKKHPRTRWIMLQGRQAAQSLKATPGLTGKLKEAVKQTNLLLPHSTLLPSPLPHHDSSDPESRSNVWVFYDSYERADDNAEHFYRYVVQNHPEISAYYALNPDSPDWARLEQEGFRLLKPSSKSFQVAIDNADVVFSSHADLDKEYPTARTHRPNGRQYKFVFLQHGVAIHDLSLWLNPKRIDMMVVSTDDEYRFIYSAESGYKFRKDQLIPAGLARWDRLRELSEQHAADGTNTSVVMMPTWRADLVRALRELPPEARVEALMKSELIAPWVEMIHNDEFRKLLAEHQLEPHLVLHPSLARAVAANAHEAPSYPSYVSLMEEVGAQELMSRAKLFLTDYSSIAFDAQVAGASIIYLQPGNSSPFDGSHTIRRGFFDYDKDALGPVTHSVDDAIEACRDALEADGGAETSSFEPGTACATTYGAIMRLLEA